MQDVITLQGLTKHYGDLVAVDHIDLSVHQGSLFAFLGPNGAGKSTTINILCTLLEKTSGEATVAGHAVGSGNDAIRRSIGVVFQDNVLDDFLTVEENLLSRGGLYGKKGEELKNRAREVAEILGITELMERRYGKLSGGQRRRAEIGRALMNDPQILFLDEPTTGLDPQTRRAVWRTLRHLQSELGMTIFLTTHYMEEADAADWVSIIDNGTIIAEGSPHELKIRHSHDTLRLTPADAAKDDIADWLKGRELPFETVTGRFFIPVSDSLAAYAILRELQGQYTAFEVVTGNMDDVFVNITGHQIREDG